MVAEEEKFTCSYLRKRKPFKKLSKVGIVLLVTLNSRTP
jgi:hypothetical protein